MVVIKDRNSLSTLALGKRSSLLNTHTTNNPCLYQTHRIQMAVELGQVKPSTGKVISSNHIVFVLILFVHLKLLPSRTLVWIHQEDKKDSLLRDPGSLHPLSQLFQKILLDKPYLIRPQRTLAFTHWRI
jgi:hypothetical protein